MKHFQKITALVAMLILSIAAVAKPQNVRLLYWNIQNGMWADQGNNYDKFVDYVLSVKPDICVWCEAKTHYKTGASESFKITDELYLPSHWADLAARYGHSYVYVGGERDFFPQVITSRFPIENVERIVGSEDNVVVSHGAGWARMCIGGKTINIVTMHTWPQIYNFGIERDDTAAIEKSGKLREGDTYRRREVEYVCKHTILTDKNASRHLWLMMGDMNSKWRGDNVRYHHAPDHTLWQAQDYIRNNTPYIDIVDKWFGPENFQPTHYNSSRIDYVYCTKPLYKRVQGVEVVRTGWPANYKIKESKKGFCYPSDHFPIIVDFAL